jgi:cobaltochelatase CobN
MHRLAAIPGPPSGDEPGPWIEQPPAPVVLLSSADTDLVAFAALLTAEPGLLPVELRGLNLGALQHPAHIDHYLNSSLGQTRVLIVRLLGGRGHWSYGIEQVRQWALAAHGRQLLLLAGTRDEEENLAGLGTVPAELAMALARCLREGGPANLRLVLAAVAELLAQRPVQPPVARPLGDPHPFDWREEPGSRVGVILYRSLLQSGDRALAEALLASLRRQGLAPRALWVSGLREAAVQRGVADLLARERVQAVLCTTAFASVAFDEAGLGAPLWEHLGVPVLQVLCSGRSRAAWQASSVGLGPLDLSLQVALPELDGRITTRVGAFKEVVGTSDRLACALQQLRPDPDRLDWVGELCGRWVELRQTAADQRRLALVLANYPTRNSRLANGVGLDTPASAVLMLQWLAAAGYTVEGPLPADGDALIAHLVRGRTNAGENDHRPPLDHISLETYSLWYERLPAAGRQRLEAVWGAPATDPGLESWRGSAAFPVRGLSFGNVCLLIQPERGYDRDPSLSYHSPDLPPTHAYLAQYLWLRQTFAAQAVVHIGKHGNLEWLPGKGLGLSDVCFPEWALGPLPHLYPFIVNDPGEGSQAKRRAQAVILDHLTPPLGRAGLHGDLQTLEALLDEYDSARQMGGERAGLLRQRLEPLLAGLQLPGLQERDPLEERLDAADSYLCELKEAQIRLGLHTYGKLPAPEPLAELLLALARAPAMDRPGLTQALALDLAMPVDPWTEEEGRLLDDDERLACVQAARSSPWQGAEMPLPRRVGDVVAWLEALALELVQALLSGTPPPTTGERTRVLLGHLRHDLMPRLLACPDAERRALIQGLAGERIAAGPSGAPTRGRPDVLPTGRNFYSVDLRGLPTEAAWDLGHRSAELLLETYLQEEGEPLRQLALSVWGTATMRNGGEDLAQALALMGVRPCWDGPTRRMVDLEVLTLRQLGRPRVDVTLRISGLFRDAFPQLVCWFDRACRRVAALDETAEDNPLAASCRAGDGAARVYGSAPGAYGAGLQGLIDSGHWQDRGDLAEAFLQWSAWRYSDQGDGGCEAEADRAGLERRLAAVQVVLHNQDNREHDLLDSDDYYQFQGGLSAAVEAVSGQRPQVWFGDHSRSSRPRMHRLERELDKVVRSRLLNPRWISGMMAHGYKGGFELAASLDYLFAYDASTGRVPDWSYGALCQAWLQEPDVQAFLRRSNPWALRDMAERLLEAHNRGLWQGAHDQELSALRQLVLESEGLIESG